MELKVGQKLRVKEFDEKPSHWITIMTKWMGKIVTFKEKEYNSNDNDRVKIYEDINENYNHGWYWRESDFQIVFETWKDVKNIIKEECDKHEWCNGCVLYNNTQLHYCHDGYFRNKDYKKLAENFEKMFGMECYVLEDEKMNFTLENIEDEMIVELRNGIIYISLGENFIGKNGFMPKHKYLPNFKCRTNSDFDIVGVYPKNNFYTNGFNGMMNITRKELWKEEQIAKDISLEEINALLKEKYPDVEKFNLSIDNDK